MRLKDSASWPISGCLGSGISGVSNWLRLMAWDATIIWETGVSSRMTIRPEAQPSATHSATTTICIRAIRSPSSEISV